MNKKKISIKKLVDKFCKTYGVDPDGILAFVYTQAICDVISEVRKLMQEEISYEEIKEDDRVN